MFNHEKLAAVIAAYKEYFPEHWKGEMYKWEAIQHFQKHWDINAVNFLDMFMEATDKTFNLLANMNNYPRGMIKAFATSDAEAVRGMFINLFDESANLAERIEQFQATAEELRVKYDDGTWRQHYQGENAITTYLWLKYPDKYYIYKYSEVRAFAKAIDSDFVPKKGGSTFNVEGGLKLYDEIREYIKQDSELNELFKNRLTDSCYPDSERVTMTIDVGFFVNRFYSQKSEETEAAWFPSDYSPNLSVEDWKRLLSDRDIFTENSLQIMKRMLDHGGQATCKQLAAKYGESANFYNSGSSSLAKKVAEKTGCPIMESGSNNLKYWPILYLGRSADKSQDGSYIWKLRDELESALNQTDLSSVELYTKQLPTIWKISHGSNCFTETENKNYEQKKVLVVHKDTAAKATSKMTQGEYFMQKMRKGDIFFLCRGNSIRLLGRIESDEPSENQEKKDGWYQREYSVIATSKDFSPYKGQHKWWTPNDNSTCIPVETSEEPLFEQLILEPYFGMKMSDLYGRKETPIQYWWLNANPKIWSFADIAVGEEQVYALYNENGNKRRIFQNFLDAKAGDMVIGYESNPVKQIVAIAQIVRENDGENLYFKKVEGLANPVDYSTLKAYQELAHMEYFANPQGSLFKLTKGEYDFIMDIVSEENSTKTQKEENEPYTKKDFLSQVYMTEERYNTLVALLKNKKNLILQGAPGVGKTFAAKRLAYSMMGEKDDSRIEFIQFHQNYSYEDFIMGYKPQDEGFKLTNGIFYQFCTNAANHPDKDYFFIIDEINRGNMSKIFGELLMLIEKDYRGTKATLAYSGTAFSVPKNLYIIGMMNTADRSLAMIDYALRRRFIFYEMEPGFNSGGFKAYQASLQNETFNALIEQIIDLNREINADDSLGAGFRIGHSYFCGQEECTEEWMKSVVYYDIIPMLREYWFDDRQKVQRWENLLTGVFND